MGEPARTRKVGADNQRIKGYVMRKTVDVHEARTHLSQLLALVSEGQEVVISKSRQARSPAGSYHGEAGAV